MIPHLLIGLLPFAVALAALQVASVIVERNGNANKVFLLNEIQVIYQVFFSRSKCQVKLDLQIVKLDNLLLLSKVKRLEATAKAPILSHFRQKEET